ncbi:hypothetical protein AB0N06_04195 [Streptomyces sp. NPDC051020]|uniref:hypothetical protein n=1 Tax=Streptomyces sp. NPDC051020 TaxID=3155409 RepID=UPI00341D7122
MPRAKNLPPDVVDLLAHDEDRVEPNAGLDEWADAWFLDSPSVAQWLISWLDGTGWWEEEVMMAEDGLQPTPWLDTARRLAASV